MSASSRAFQACEEAREQSRYNGPRWVYASVSRDGHRAIWVRSCSADSEWGDVAREAGFELHLIWAFRDGSPVPRAIPAKSPSRS